MNRGALIDPFKREITRLPFPDLAACKAAVGTDDLDHMTLAVEDDLRLSLCGFCDGEGYYKQPMAWSRIGFYEHPLPGRVFVYVADAQGETTDMSDAIFAVLQVGIEWLDAQPELPPITVNGEIVVDFNAPDRPKTREETMRRLGLGKPQ